MSHAGGRGIASVDVTVLDVRGASADRRDVVIEQPLEVRIAGETVTTTMRTPGDDHALALGFLVAEGVLRTRADVGSVYVCGRTDDPRYGSAIEVVPGPGVSLDVDRIARASRPLITSACGVCGRDGIEDLRARLPVIARVTRVPAALLLSAPARLRTHQDAFARTGGLHGACALDVDGQVLAHAEDVGRHNAVDKVVGQLFLAGELDGSARRAQVLAISGRASFEIVQKAAMAGFVAIAAVSAPSTLAIETAQATGIALACFVRDGAMTLYAGRERVVADG